ncbi:MAG: hypothetical protein DRH70_07925 [Candidatus Coatesbacteria bacterium]|nr:MAG: hypothetical protein DRH70_07925 [Candidatus Coatesbacteria bacterium]
MSLECGGLTPLSFAVARHRAPIDSFISFRKAIAAAMIEIRQMARQAATRNGGVNLYMTSFGGLPLYVAF